VSYDDIKSGVVILYPYLWSQEAKRGETEGRKHRPSVVAIRVARINRSDLLILFPITTKAPKTECFAVEIPELEKRRAGLDIILRQWLILDECNEETIPGSYYLEPDARIGAFSKPFLLPLIREFIARRESVKVTSRKD
jgi:hypothetical protein